MENASLSFHLTSRDHDQRSSAENDAFSAQFIHSLDLKVSSGCWSVIDLRSPRIHEFVSRASQLIQDGTATFYGINHLEFAWQEDKVTPVEWYQLIGKSRIDCEYLRQIETVKADRMPRDSHVAYGMFSNQYVSERFKQVVETNRLTGVEFVWLQDRGKYQAPQWYLPVAQNPMGRGVDHPWFDSRTLKGSDSWQPLSQRFRTGVWNFDLDQIRKNLKLESPYPELFELYKVYPEGDLCVLGIRSYRTYVRRYLPKTDFAFLWHQEDSIEDRSKWKQRGLCANRKAVEILLKHRLVSPSEIMPVRIVDELSEDDEALDEIGELPEAYYSQEELVQIRKNLEPAWQRHISTAKPTRETTIEKALSMLRRAKKRRPEDFNKPLRSDKRAVLVLPAHWLAVLSITDDARLNSDCQIASASALPDLLVEFEDDLKSLYDDYPFERRHMPIGSGADGDIFSVEGRGPSQIDSKVFRLSHEGFTIEYVWETIPLFISDMLSGFYD